MVEKGKERMVITGDGFGYSVKAESKKGLKKIVLIRDSETGSQTLFDLTGYGKLDNPFLPSMITLSLSCGRSMKRFPGCSLPELS
jgi:hypothetical protein